MKKFNLRFSLLILGVIGLILGFIPLLNDTNYGLDLKGGFEVLYQIKPLQGDKLTSDMVTATYKTFSRRIDNLGVTEPEISIESGDRIRVKLAGVTNKEEARTVLSKATSLSFRDTSDNLLMTSDVLNSGLVKVSSDKEGRPAVMLPVKNIDKFFEVTSNVSKQSDNRIVIWLDFEEEIDSFAAEQNFCGTFSDSNCLSAATVSQGFASDVIIEGNFTKEEATTLVELINSGSLPTKVTELSSKTVSASFGENSLNKTFFAGLIGIAIVFIVMTGLYHFAGFIASLGLVIYTFLVFLIFWIFGGVLTLPGIASLLLGIGMAVDANVLSFERIKEELWAGSSLKEAFKAGYTNSLTSIIDANVTTLIVAVILFIFGESSVKGFATMLIISIFVTVFIMVYVVKWLLNMFIKTGFLNKKPKVFINVNPRDIPDLSKKDHVVKVSRFKKVDFLKYRKLFFALSLTIFIVGSIFTFVFGLNLSVDFKGGTDFTITDKETLKVEDVEKDFKDLGYDKLEVSNIDDKTVYVKMSSTLSENEIKDITSYFENTYEAEVENGAVSTIVKQELVKNAITSLILAIVGIIIYVSIRFAFAFAVSAIVALFHDVFFVIAMFSIFRLEIDTIFIASILTIIGYSINDTVVIFDRIREERNLHPKDDLYKIVNESLGVTMTRSLYTGLTAITMVICLLIFGSHEISTFNIAMLLGMLIGCYSSICIASPLWYEMVKNKKNASVEKKKKVYKDKYEELTVKGINS